MISNEASGAPQQTRNPSLQKPLNIGTRPTRRKLKNISSWQSRSTREYMRGIETAFAGGFVSLGQACMEAHDFALRPRSAETRAAT